MWRGRCTPFSAVGGALSPRPFSRLLMDVSIPSCLTGPRRGPGGVLFSDYPLTIGPRPCIPQPYLVSAVGNERW